MSEKNSSWDLFWRNKDGRITVWQFPNPPLIAWLVFMVLSRVMHDGRLHAGYEFLSMAALFTWAYLEITSGESYFRKMLGGVVLLVLVISRFK